MSEIFVLNNDYTFLGTVSVKKSFRLVFNQKAIVECWSNDYIRTPSKKIPIPSIIRLTQFIKSIYKRKLHWNNKRVFIRDNYTCVYCGKENLVGIDLTIDHVFPRSRGGLDHFDNTVTSCKGCNTYKADKTPEEAQMRFYDRKFKPYEPYFNEILYKSNKEKIRKLNKLLKII